MRPLGRNIPWKSISIPWNGRSIPWNFRSKAIFRWKNSPGLCHIAAKTAFSGVLAVVDGADVLNYQVLPFFAQTQPSEQARGKIASSVLKKQRPAGFAVLPPHDGLMPCRGAFVSCRERAGRPFDVFGATGLSLPGGSKKVSGCASFFHGRGLLLQREACLHAPPGAQGAAATAAK